MSTASSHPAVRGRTLRTAGIALSQLVIPFLLQADAGASLADRPLRREAPSVRSLASERRSAAPAGAPGAGPIDVSDLGPESVQ